MLSWTQTQQPGAVQRLPTCLPRCLSPLAACVFCRVSCSCIPVNWPTSLLKSQLESALSYVSSTKLPACS